MPVNWGEIKNTKSSNSQHEYIIKQKTENNEQRPRIPSLFQSHHMRTSPVLGEMPQYFLENASLACLNDATEAMVVPTRI